MPLIWIGAGLLGSFFVTGTAQKTADATKYVAIAVILLVLYKFSKDVGWIKGK